MNLVSRKTVVLFFLPGAIFMALFLIYPILRMVMDGFYDFDIYTNEKTFVGLENYIRAFSDENFLGPMKNTLIYVVVAVSIETLIGLVLSLVFVQKFPGSKVLRSLMLAPLMVAPLISGLTWRLLFNANFGYINQILRNLHILKGTDTITWLADKRLSLAAAIVADIWLTVPFMMLMFLAGLQSIDESMLEAAELDGANYMQKLIYIKLPDIAPVLLTAVAIRTIDAARTFDIIYVMVDEQVTVFSTLIYKTLVKYQHIGYASAMAVLFILFFVLFTLICLQNMWRPKKEGR